MKCSLEFKGWIFMRLMSPFIFMDKRNFFEWIVLLQFIPAAFIPAVFALTAAIVQRHTIMYKVQCTHLYSYRTTTTINQSYFIPKWVAAANVNNSLFYNLEGLYQEKAYEAFLHQTTKTYKTQLQFFLSVAYAHNSMS